MGFTIWTLVLKERRFSLGNMFVELPSRTGGTSVPIAYAVPPIDMIPHGDTHVICCGIHRNPAGISMQFKQKTRMVLNKRHLTDSGARYLTRKPSGFRGYLARMIPRPGGY